MSGLDSVIQRNSASAEELASTAEELSGQAAQLRESVSFFQLGNNRRGQVTAPKAGVKITRKPSRERSANQNRPEPRGVTINLDDNTGDNDAQDNEFAA
jgi:methyl-accepting chemotaxis protein